MPDTVSTSASACPSCGSDNIRLSQKKETGDSEHSNLGENPYRCRNCRTRFYAHGPIAAQHSRRSRTASERLREFWKHRRGPIVQAAIFLLVLALFLLCLRYLAHDHPDTSPPATWLF